MVVSIKRQMTHRLRQIYVRSRVSCFVFVFLPTKFHKCFSVNLPNQFYCIENKQIPFVGHCMSMCSAETSQTSVTHSTLRRDVNDYSILVLKRKPPTIESVFPRLYVFLNLLGGEIRCYSRLISKYSIYSSFTNF